MLNQDEYLSSAELRDELLEKYPKKAFRKRSKQIVVNDPEEPPVIGANSRTTPGVITQRGCCYAGCRGVVIGPIYDIVHITHGPIGCGYYSWLSRRNLAKPPEGSPNYIQYAMSTDMTEEEIVFGGEKKLAKAIDEAVAEFNPKGIAIYSTCPVGLIGDDIHSVAKEAMKKYPEVNIVGFSCEGYKGVSQSSGHHIANNKVFTNMVGLDDTPQTTPFNINILGEYNIGGDAWVIDDIMKKCGIHVVGTLSGDVSYQDIKNCHTVDLNAVMCYRSINYMAEMMESKYGIPWTKVNFIGAEATAKSLRKIAAYFDNTELTERVEHVIRSEMRKLQPQLDVIKPRLEGKKVALFVGGSRAHHYQELFKEMGMEVIAAGYEFAHRDDYEGRRVLGDIKMDADSRNIEDLTIEADPERFKPRKTEEELEALKEQGVFQQSEYEGMMSEMKKDTLIIDDISHHEMDVLIEKAKPDIICSGVKDKYVIEKFGIPCKQLHSYDYGGPYAGFEGAINFYKEIDRMIHTKAWKYAIPPWMSSHEVEATLVHEKAIS